MRRALPYAAIVAAVGAAAFFGWRGFRGWERDREARAVLENPYLSDTEKLKRLRRVKFRAVDVFEGRDAASARLFDRLGKTPLTDPEAAEAVAAEAEALAPLVGSRSVDFHTLAMRAGRRAEELRAERIRKLSGDEALVLYDDFRRRHPGSPLVAELEPLVRRFEEARSAEEWRQIRSLPRRLPADFRELSRRIRGYASKFPAHPARADFDRLRDVCDLLSERRLYHLRLGWSDSAGEAYDHVLEVWGLNQKIQVRGEARTARQTWNAERTFEWQPGEGIEVKLFDADTFGWDLLGRKARGDGAAIGLLAGEVALDAVDQKDCRVSFELAELPRAAWEVYQRHLGP